MKKRFVLAYDSRGIESSMAGKAWQPSGKVWWRGKKLVEHIFIHIQEGEKEGDRKRKRGRKGNRRREIGRRRERIGG